MLYSLRRILSFKKNKRDQEFNRLACRFSVLVSEEPSVEDTWWLDILLDLFRDGFRLGDLESLIDVIFFNFFFFFCSSSSPWLLPFWFCKTDGDNFSHIWLESKSAPNSTSLSSILFPFDRIQVFWYESSCFSSSLFCFAFVFSFQKGRKKTILVERKVFADSVLGDDSIKRIQGLVFSEFSNSILKSRYAIKINK